MRIAVISRGDFFHVKPYLRAMVDADWDVHWLQITPSDDVVPGVTVHACHPPGGHHSKLLFLIGGGRARTILRRLQPDMVNAHYASSAGLVACRSGYRPYVVTVHGTDLFGTRRRLFGRVVLRSVFRHARLVNPVAEHMKPYVVQLGARCEDVLPITFGIDLDVFRYRPETPFPGGRIHMICTRSVSRKYDVGTLLEAMAAARADGVRLSLSLPGSGEDEEHFRREAEAAGLGKDVHFGGGYRNEKLPELFSGCDVYVSPSPSDGASISLMEAMACGLFPVVTDIPANTEWIRDGRTAITYPVGDARRLAAALCELPDRKEMVAGALPVNRRVVEERADRQQNLQAFLDALARAAEDPNWHPGAPGAEAS